MLPDGAWKNGDPPSSDEVWSGHRELTPDEIHRLAVAIVDEVKLRGPFLSLADFVNRRLAEDETGRMGALQAAIEKAGLNSSLGADYPLGQPEVASRLPASGQHQRRHPPRADPQAGLQSLGRAGWLTQADVLQVARSGPERPLGHLCHPRLRRCRGCQRQNHRPRLVRGRRPAHARADQPDDSGLNPTLTGRMAISAGVSSSLRSAGSRKRMSEHQAFNPAVPVATGSNNE